MITALGIFLMICSSVCDFCKVFVMLFFFSSHHTYRKFQKKKQTHTLAPHYFPLKNHGKSFFLNHLFLQFNSRLNGGFYFCEKSLSEEILGILLYKNEFCKYLYFPKIELSENLNTFKEVIKSWNGNTFNSGMPQIIFWIRVTSNSFLLHISFVLKII